MVRVRLHLSLREALGEYVELGISGCIKAYELLEELRRLLNSATDTGSLVVVRNGVGLGKNDVVCKDDVVDVLPLISGG